MDPVIARRVLHFLPQIPDLLIGFVDIPLCQVQHRLIDAFHRRVGGFIEVISGRQLRGAARTRQGEDQ